jgi:MerR family transcriptional regulator, light-induced transcriptional regulator
VESDITQLMGKRSSKERSSSTDDVLSTIEEQIVPKLVLSQGVPSVAALCADERPPPNEAEIEDFTRLAANGDVMQLLSFIETMATQGVSLDVILLQLLAPAARLLGEQWADDTRSYVEVTVGLSTIQQVVHMLSPSYAPTDLPQRGFVVLTSPQGEQHTLGLYIVAELVRRAGWSTQATPDLPTMDLVALVKTRRVDAVGISVSNYDLVERVPQLVTRIRQASMNPSITIMLGGSLLLVDKSAEVGAVFCPDAKDAVRRLEAIAHAPTVAGPN